MFRVVLPTIEILFAGDGRSRQPVNFSWRLIRRKHQPFLLLPVSMTNIGVGLELYPAQRRRAKIWRVLLPLMFKTPAASLFARVRFDADAGSDIMQFLAQQSGVPAGRMSAPAIKFGGVPQQKSRVVLLLCDETRRPVSVVKVGLNPAGREATNREADLLEKLPADTLGCIRMTGRLNTPALSAFATNYYPGASPDNDAGMDRLFHAWLNPGPFVPLANLPTWQGLAAAVAEADPGAWQVLNAALARRTVRTTLYHGDFAPWNIRAINAQNLQVHDWERGSLQGIPGWDWFHFVVQTAILARRHSVQRVTAEVEQLLGADRFNQYAAEAGIRDFVQPLLLAYLLHQQWVIKPLEGRARTSELFELLSERWQMTPRPSAIAVVAPAGTPNPGFWNGAVAQLKSAAVQLSNLFWEPKLTAKASPSLGTQFLGHWPVVLLAGLMLGGVASAHYLSNAYLLFLPFYLAPCTLLTWKIDRRWGTLAAIAGALAGPLIQSAKDAAFHRPGVMGWNIIMRFISLELCVLFVGQIRKQKNLSQRCATPNHVSAKLNTNWAVLLASGVLFVIVLALDSATDPHLLFLPLYLLPCMILTLVLGLRWGMAAAVVVATGRSLMEYTGDPNYAASEVFGWNLAMRLAVFLVVILLLDRIRRDNILFSPVNHNLRRATPSGR